MRITTPRGTRRGPIPLANGDVGRGTRRRAVNNTNPNCTSLPRGYRVFLAHLQYTQQHIHKPPTTHPATHPQAPNNTSGKPHVSQTATYPYQTPPTIHQSPNANTNQQKKTTKQTQQKPKINLSQSMLNSATVNAPKEGKRGGIAMIHQLSRSGLKIVVRRSCRQPKIVSKSMQI